MVVDCRKSVWKDVPTGAFGGRKHVDDDVDVVEEVNRRDDSLWLQLPAVWG